MSYVGNSSDATLAFEDAQVTQPFSREKTDNTDYTYDTDDTDYSNDTDDTGDIEDTAERESTERTESTESTKSTESTEIGIIVVYWTSTFMHFGHFWVLL